MPLNNLVKTCPFSNLLRAVTAFGKDASLSKRSSEHVAKANAEARSGIGVFLVPAGWKGVEQASPEQAGKLKSLFSRGR